MSDPLADLVKAVDDGDTSPGAEAAAVRGFRQHSVYQAWAHVIAGNRASTLEAMIRRPGYDYEGFTDMSQDVFRGIVIGLDLAARALDEIETLLEAESSRRKQKMAGKTGLGGV